MIKIEHLSYSVNRPILDNISFRVKEGEIHGIVGLSGAGKSTLLKLIAGFLPFQEGAVYLNKKKLVGPNDKLVPGYEEIQLVNQDFALDLYHTVAENIEVQILHLDKKTRADFVEELLDLVDLQPIRNLQAHLISGGEKQRLAIARALAKESRFILLDEPFSQLDVYIKDNLMRYLLALRKVRNVGIILVTHNGKEAMAMCDTIHFLNEGKFKRTATPEEFYLQPKSSYEANFFGEINEIRLNRKKVLFRPHQYALEGKDEKKIDVKFKSTLFQGAYYANYFETSKGERIVLYADKKMRRVKEIFLIQ